MNTQMKGLLKGLRYISKIFDGKEEQEMQIGYPTDVKHVAHIGWDGPSVTAPTWMNEFPSAPHSASFASDGLDPNASTQDSSVGNGSHREREPTESMKARRRPQHLAGEPEMVGADSGPHSGPQEPSELVKPRRRRQPSNGGQEDSPRRDSNSTGSRHSRRHQSDAGLSIDSPGRDHSESRRGRRQHKSAGSGEAESDLPAIPKQSRQRKSKGSSGSKEGSTRSRARSKAPTSLLDAGAEEGSTKSLPALEPMPERKEEEEERL